MSKQEFLAQLRKGLSGLPHEDIEERLTFYSEIIDDRMEDGLPEEEAVCQIGDLDDIIPKTVADTPLARLEKEKTQPKRRLRAWEIILIVLGSPIWLSLLIAAFAVVFSLYVSVWSVIISLWAVFASFIGCALGGIVAGIGFAIGGNGLTGVGMVSAGSICAGLSILTFFGCKAVTKGTLFLTKTVALGIKNCFVKKERA